MKKLNSAHTHTQRNQDAAAAAADDDDDFLSLASM
jgi:hypothetical protein